MKSNDSLKIGEIEAYLDRLQLLLMVHNKEKEEKLRTTFTIIEGCTYWCTSVFSMKKLSAKLTSANMDVIQLEIGLWCTLLYTPM
ncbi:hypothetical protein C5167_034119 [Papaver somniferum]|uniref:Uncharacterized protein n=1 Tax=Papaver somniferum TaxID=3469 RepID=A0A4Y7KGC2_PAPSO|nr:hypothetical protein C5167_034119 [Papaver somniferum]